MFLRLIAVTVFLFLFASPFFYRFPLYLARSGWLRIPLLSYLIK